jgi:hypothetical protein
MFELKPPDGTTRPELRDAAFRSWSPLRESIGEAVRAGLLAGDPEELTHLFWAGLHGILSLHLADKLTHGMDLADLQGPMKRLMFVGSSAAASDPD